MKYVKYGHGYISTASSIKMQAENIRRVRQERSNERFNASNYGAKLKVPFSCKDAFKELLAKHFVEAVWDNFNKCWRIYKSYSFINRLKEEASYIEVISYVVQS